MQVVWLAADHLVMLNIGDELAQIVSVVVRVYAHATTSNLKDAVCVRIYL